MVERIVEPAIDLAGGSDGAAGIREEGAIAQRHCNRNEWRSGGGDRELLPDGERSRQVELPGLEAGCIPHVDVDRLHQRAVGSAVDVDDEPYRNGGVHLYFKPWRGFSPHRHVGGDGIVGAGRETRGEAFADDLDFPAAQQTGCVGRGKNPRQIGDRFPRR